jgi:hypothetical protein
MKARVTSLTRCASRSFGTASCQCVSIDCASAWPFLDGFFIAATPLVQACLMPQAHWHPRARAVNDRKADLERRHSPRAVGQRRLAVGERAVELVDDLGARHLGRRQRMEPRRNPRRRS